MHNRVLILMILLMAIMTNACSQNGRYYRKAKKHYERGNIETAVLEACRSLRIKPDSKKTQDLLLQVWNQAQKNHDQNVAELGRNSDASSYEQILAEHLKLKELASNVKTLPPLVNPNTGYRVVLNIPDLSDEIASSRDNAAEAHYQAGVRFTKMSKAVDIQRKAAQEFKAAMSIVPDYKDSELKYDQARKLAIKRIAIAPFTDKSNSYKRYGAISEIISDYIISKVMRLGYLDEYTEIIARSQMDAVLAEQQLNASGLVDEASTVNLGQLLGAHEVLSGSILQVNVSSVRVSTVDKTAKAKVVVGKESYVDDDGKTQERDVLGEVSCEYRMFTKSTSATISGSFSVVDVETGKILMHESVESKTPWSDSWYRKLRGDERALSRATQSMMDKSEPFPPENGELILTSLYKMGDIVVAKLGSFLK